MKAKILIVEDDESISKNLMTLFSSLEYEVNSELSAETAYETIESNLPDLIICDINLPKMSGYELKEKLNELKTTFNIPFIFLTARNTYEDLRKGMKLAADDFIFKPFKAEDIVKSVELRLLKYEGRKNDWEEDYLFLKVNNAVKKVSVKNISLILGENQYSRICQINAKDYLIRRSLNKWETILPQNFKRVGRSAIVNLKKIVEIESLSGGKYLHVEGSSKKVKVTKIKILEDFLMTNKAKTQV